jgi:hypothetical protein
MPATLKKAVEEDALIQALIDAKGKRVEIIAFGIPYAGTLHDIDMEDGIITIIDGEDSAVLEIERIESFSLLSKPGP